VCGIAGILRLREARDDTAVVEAMCAEIVRRGPDDAGVVREGRATLGNRRLAILDLSAAGHQPMRSASGRLLITFNGEIYNYRDIAKELGLGERDLKSHSDTEVILHAWERWGEDALERMVGQWAFAMWDGREERLWLARDRFGEKPLFFHRDADALAFASSVAALVKAPWVPREIDESALFELVSTRYVLSPRTVLRDVKKLGPGEIMRVDAAGVDVRRWYAPVFRRGSRRKHNDTVEEFGALFANATRRCLVSDVPVALLLSDGIDSNGIRASLDGQGVAPRCFTFDAADANAPGATPRVDAGPGTTVVRATPEERMELIRNSFLSFTEPVGDGASVATWTLIHRAREHATVFLCGHGGDELLGGYWLSKDRYRLASLDRFKFLPTRWLSGRVGRLANGTETPEELVRRLRERPHRRSPEAVRYMINRALKPAELCEIYAQPDVPREYLGQIDALYANCSDEARDIDRMQEVMLRTFLSTNILTYADSTAMDSSAELRMPFLDRDLVAFALSLPPSMRVGRFPGRTNTKLVLRHWARGKVPPEVNKRRKRGFTYARLPDVIARDRATVKEHILGVDSIRRLLPGAESWLSHSPHAYGGATEGTLWALLSLGIWCGRVGVK
jgi:asparagine synthase (glutamine-hydrolysing)